MSSENPSGADNQQERLFEGMFLAAFDESRAWRSKNRILRGHTQSSTLKRVDEEMVQALQRCGETVPNYNRPKVAKFLVG